VGLPLGLHVKGDGRGGGAHVLQRVGGGGRTAAHGGHQDVLEDLDLQTCAGQDSHCALTLGARSRRLITGLLPSHDQV